MTPSTWARITELFERAVDLTPDERTAYLAELFMRDPAAATELASLLEAHDRPDEFLPALPHFHDPPDLAGRVVGAYRLIRLLGTGGTGAVYLAERSDGTFAKHVAVKLLSASFLPLRDRFLRERQLLARLEHPNIARLLDAGATADHLLYLVMEYVEGVPLDRYCAARRATVNERVGLLQQVCAGVAHAHRNLIIHCDIKPENVLVAADGTVKLLDFGIARQLDPSGAVTRNRPATPAYSSPEQLQGGAITTASDVYSLGVLAYFVLTGSGPYALRSDRLDEVVRAVLTAEPQRASSIPGLAAHHARRLRGDLDTILAKAVAKEPDRRYASIEQLADDFAAFRSGDPVRARPDTLAYRAFRTVRRHPIAYAVAATLSVGLIAATLTSAVQARLAQRRFEDLRAFAHAAVFDVNDALVPIPGTTGARKLVVETALQYLDRLDRDGVSDPALREELAAAYIRIGKVQGGAFVPNLGDSAGAAASFRKAIVAAGGEHSAALERLRIEALINVAQLSSDPIRGVPDFDAAVAAAEHRLGADRSDIESLRLLADAFHGRATAAHLTNNVAEHEAMAARQIEVRERLSQMRRGEWQDEASLARAFAQLALALEQRGDYEGALVQLERARAALDAVMTLEGPNQMLERGLAEVRSRRVPVLLALGRADDAARAALSAIDLLQPLVASDALNIQYKADLAYAWLRLGDARRAEGRMDEALELHRKALAVRRERAARHAGFIFVPWELTRSLNSVADLLLAVSPPQPAEAAALFAEARDAGVIALEKAPSFTQVRKQVAVAEEGLARAALARGGTHAGTAGALLARSAATWREIVARSSGDESSTRQLARVEALLAAGPSAAGPR
jgi:non-specific serine/threonine protein kinase/serine/threonine-protein kinase